MLILFPLGPKQGPLPDRYVLGRGAHLSRTISDQYVFAFENLFQLSHLWPFLPVKSRTLPFNIKRHCIETTHPRAWADLYTSFTSHRSPES